jgi:general stress protein 26
MFALQAALALWLCAVPETQSPSAPVPQARPVADLNLATDEAAVLAGARALMLADENTALVTVDADGRPRVRTVRAFVDPAVPGRPESGVTVWIMTRRTTRKVDQIAQNDKVALYFSDDEKVSYATVMGRAIVHTDPGNARAKRHYDADYAKFFWPAFPADFVMIEVQPDWLEYMGPGVPNHREHWRPQAVVFGR